MRLRSIEVGRLDGLNGPIAARGLVPGVNVVVGPNASGKSSLIRAVLAVLYPEALDGLADVRLDLVADDGSALTAHRLGESVRWLRAGAETDPPPLPARETLGAYVLELEDLVALRSGRGLKAGGPTEEAIARQLQLELTGGVDLAAIRKRLPKPTLGLQKASRDLRNAEQALKALRLKRQRLHEEELRLASDEAELEAQRRLAARAGAVESARRLVAALRDAAAAEARLRELPPEVAELGPGDLGQVDGLARDLRRALDVAAEKQRLLREAEEVVRRSRLPDGLTEPAARAHARLADVLCELEDRARLTAAELAGARAAADDAWRAMGGIAAHPGAAEVDRSRVDEAARAAFDLESAMREEAALARGLHELETRLAELGGPVGASTGHAPTEEPRHGAPEGPADAAPSSALAGEERQRALQRAAVELSRWLEEPPPAPRVPGWAWPVGILLAVAAVLASSLLPAPWPTVAAGAVFAWLLAAAVASGRAASRRRDDAPLRRAVAAAGLPLPEELGREAVTAALAEALEASSRERRRSEERGKLAAEAERRRWALAEATERRLSVAARLEELRDHLGFGAKGDAGFVQWMSAARDHLHHQTRVRELEARLRETEAQLAEVRARVTAHLVQAGEAVDDDAPGAVLRERCLTVCDAAVAVATAKAKAAELRRDIAAATERSHDLARRLADLASRLGYGVEGLERPEAWAPLRVEALRRRVAMLGELRPVYEAARHELMDAGARAAMCRAALARDPELAAAAEAQDLAAIEAVAAAAKEADERVRQLGQDIGALKERLAHASRERELERATAAVRRARDALEAHRRERLEDAAVAFLLDDVEAEHEAVTKPAALERARAWFGRVTHGEFELTFEHREGEGWRFGAVDRRPGAEGRALRLEELSTGTRTQLLVSARLAYALTLEEGGAVETLPFVLDEALTTSDPERFKQVASAVLDVVEASGRQFVYLSARPEDATLWRRAAASRPAVPLEVIELSGNAAAREAATA